jgi:hypothetical protein
VDPEPEFEQAVAAFVATLARGDAGAPFRAELAALLAELEPTARRITLVRTVLQLLGPGTPDVYQGDEHRLLALVDPDNRRAVDFYVRAAALEQAGGDAADAEKLGLVRACLALRAAHPEAFTAAGYTPLVAEGAGAGAVIAFARVHGPWALLVAAERPASRRGATWGGDTVLWLPAPLAGLGWQRVAGMRAAERPLRADGGGVLAVGDLLGPDPVAVLLAAPARRPPWGRRDVAPAQRLLRWIVSGRVPTLRRNLGCRLRLVSRAGSDRARPIDSSAARRPRGAAAARLSFPFVLRFPMATDATLTVAYFSMEICLEQDVPTYSGGLGVLAGDTLRSAADLRLPVVGSRSRHRHGYFRQHLELDGTQSRARPPGTPPRACPPCRTRSPCRWRGAP